MISYQKEHNIKAAAVIGGGLLYDLGMETHIIEYAPILMSRQVHIHTMPKNARNQYQSS